MRYIALFIVILFVSTVYAAGTYTTTIDGSVYDIVFAPGPFGPGEQGTAYLYKDGNLSFEYDYTANMNNGVMFYDIKNLCWMYEIYDGYQLIAFQPIGIEMKLE